MGRMGETLVAGWWYLTETLPDEAASKTPSMLRKRLRSQADLHLERMFETRSQAWEQVGLAVTVSQRAIRRAQRQALVLVPLLIGVLVAWHFRDQILGINPHARHPQSADNTLGGQAWRWATVAALLAIGWAAARDFGKAAAPTFFRRMDPATAGTVGFLIRLGTMAIIVLAALHVAGAQPQTLLAGSAFTAVVFGLAAQQTLGNVIAGTVLLSARPFRVGERVKFQAGAVGGTIEGVVSSLGLLYTTLVRVGEDTIMIPNSVVLAAAVIPLKEPDSVDVRVRLSAGILPTQVQAILDHQITTPTKSTTVAVEEIDGDDVVVRVQAIPERGSDGGRLADEVIRALATVTGEHEVVGTRSSDGSTTPDPAVTRDAPDPAVTRDAPDPAVTRDAPDPAVTRD
jgi:small conductance mechanosensitive channel